jgi:hypothetical protein
LLETMRLHSLVDERSATSCALVIPPIEGEEGVAA